MTLLDSGGLNNKGVKEATMSYRILSLDGGGTWALIQVKALMALSDYDEKTPGHQVLSDFDLLAANSGGSIVLGLLVENFTLGDIRALFEDESQRRSIFSLAGLGDVLLHDLADNLAQLVPQTSNFNLRGIVPKYSARNKLSALQKVMSKTGNLSLAQAAAGVRGHSAEHIHLLITAFDYDLNRAVFFRSSQVSGPGWGKGQPAEGTLAGANSRL